MKKAVKFWCVALSVAMVAVFGVPGDASAGKTVGTSYLSDLMGQDDVDYEDYFSCSDGIAAIGTISDGYQAVDRITVRCGGNESWAYKWVGSNSGRGGENANYNDQIQHVSCSPNDPDDDHRVTGLKVNLVGKPSGGEGIQSIQVHCSNGDSRTIGNLKTQQYGAAQEENCAAGTGSVDRIELYWGDDFGPDNYGGIKGLKFQCSASAASPK